MDRPYLIATILDTSRLWPTTLVLPRPTTRPSLRRGRDLPAGTTLVALSSYLHRPPLDPVHLPTALDHVRVQLDPYRPP